MCAMTCESSQVIGSLTGDLICDSSLVALAHLWLPPLPFPLTELEKQVRKEEEEDVEKRREEKEAQNISQRMH